MSAVLLLRGFTVATAQRRLLGPFDIELEAGGCVGIIGVGNCASSFVQGVHYYRNAKDSDFVPGLMHVNLGGYHVRDIEFSAAIGLITEGCRKIARIGPFRQASSSASGIMPSSSRSTL